MRRHPVPVRLTPMTSSGFVLRGGLGCWPACVLPFLLDLCCSIIFHCHTPVYTMAGVLKKYELEAKLKDEHTLIQQGILRDENPLDLTSDFTKFLGACRKGDLKTCQELISNGVNINGKDAFDYTPLIIASLCGHFELVQLLLESGTPPCDTEMASPTEQMLMPMQVHSRREIRSRAREQCIMP